MRSVGACAPSRNRRPLCRRLKGVVWSVERQGSLKERSDGVTLLALYLISARLDRDLIDFIVRYVQ
jgi:hypothetical protein